MDEVFGFVPPTANPPSKKPILTILKQARAYGVGMVLSTQNPVDLDYKAMSNAGPWMVGRLQTERDKARILEALESAAGGRDMKAIDEMISGLGKRQFLVSSRAHFDDLGDDRAEEQLATAHRRMEELDIDVDTRKRDELVSAASDVLSMLLGGRRSRSCPVPHGAGAKPSAPGRGCGRLRPKCRTKWMP
jgi:hypothetical protein